MLFPKAPQKERRKQRRVVITGMSTINPIGQNSTEYWSNLLSGKCGIKSLSSFDAATYRTKIAGEVAVDLKKTAEQFGVKKASKMERVALLGIATARNALQDSGIDPSKSVNTEDMGVVIGSGVGGMMYYEDQILGWLNDGVKKVHPNSILRITPNTVSSNVAINLNCFGPDLTISTACSSGSHAIGISFLMIKSGLVDKVITGGVEAPLSPVLFAAFDNMKVMSTKNGDPKNACRPFDVSRDGFVLSEGAAIVILEDMDAAKKRGAKIYAEVCGYGQSSGGYHMVIPAPDGIGESKAMSHALNMSGLNPEDIDYVNAHGTGTVANDVSESCAIRRAFKNRVSHLLLSSTKSQTGHLIGAAGALGCMTAAFSIANEVVPANSNLEKKDPKCDLNYLEKEPIKKKIRNALANSFGFGNNNASIVLRSFK